MITVKPFCKKRPTKKGYPLYIYININGDKNYYPLKRYVGENQFDEDGDCVINHENSFRINNLISEKVNKINRIIIDLETHGRKVDYETICKLLESNNPNSFINYCRECLSQDKGSVAFKTYLGFKYGIDWLEKYRPDVSFSDIDYLFLDDFQKWLKKNGLESWNSTYQVFAAIRKYYRRALRQGLVKGYPFDEFQLKTQEGDKDYLTEPERDNLYTIFNENKVLTYRERKTLGNWLLTTYTGVPADDMEKGNKLISFTETHLIYIRGKTKSKTKTKIKIPLSEKAKVLAEFVKENKLDSTRSRVHDDLKSIMSKAGIDKHITYHAGRNTFAIISLMKGIDIRAIQKILGHKSVKTTEKYQRIIDDFVEQEMKKMDL